MKLIKMMTMLMAMIATLNAAPKEPALGGYCPVCYLAAGKANMGDAKFTSEYKGELYQFVSADVKAIFDKDPVKYLPQYDGLCAYGMSLGKKFASDPTVFTVVDGKVYLNKDASIQKLFAKGTKGHLVKADQEWKKMAMAAEVEMKKEEMMKK